MRITVKVEAQVPTEDRKKAKSLANRLVGEAIQLALFHSGLSPKCTLKLKGSKKSNEHHYTPS